MTDEENRIHRLGWISRNFRTKLLIFSIFAVAFILVAGLFMFVYIPPGHAGIFVDPATKSVSDSVVGPSWYIKMPWVEYKQIYIAVDTLGMWGDGTDPYADYPGVDSESSDLLTEEIDILMRWQLDPAKLRELYLSYPYFNWEDAIISSIAREEIRFKTKEFSAIETITKRDVIASELESAIIQRLKTEVSLHGAVINFELDLRDIKLPDAYTASIELKLIAEQDKLRAEFERERTLILANATAQAVIIQAYGESQAKIVVAEGIQQAIQMIIASSGLQASEEIAQLYIWAEAIREVASEIDILIITTGEDGIPIIYQIPPSS